MNKASSLSVIIASYNDKDIIQSHFSALLKVLGSQSQYDWEIIYVDDGSTDGSVEVLKSLVSANPNVTLIELARNFGQQKAFFAGIKLSRGDIVITLDGDYQYEPRCLIDLADKVKGGFDLVSGIRTQRHDPLWPRLSSRIGRFFVQRVLRYPVKDFGSVKAYSRFLADKIVRYDNYCIMPHGTAFALTNRIAEVEVMHRPRPVGRSKWTFTKRLHMYFDLFLAYSSYETSSLIKCGGFSILLGVSTLTVLLYLFLVHHIFLFHTFTAVTALWLTGGGFALLFGSFLLSFLLRIYRQLLWKGESSISRGIYRHIR